jgi:hypothetical protein
MVDFVAGFLSAWILRSLLERRLRQLDRDIAIARRRGSNPPPPGRKPAPPAGPPEQPLAAQLIRYWAWEEELVRQALRDGYQPRPQGGTPNPPPAEP